MDNALIIGRLGAMLFWALIVGFLAKRKNRNPFLWRILGALSWLIALIILAFLSFVCKNCGEKVSKEVAKTGSCPNCI